MSTVHLLKSAELVQRQLRKGVGKKWTRGTVFVQNFKITEVLAEYAPE